MTGPRGAILTGLLALLLLAPFLGARPVQNPDEPREAEIARECAEGEWTAVPRLNGKPFLEHPPLYYWLTAASMRLAGEPTDASAKGASVLLGVLTVLGTWLLAETLLGAGAGVPAALLLLATPFLFLRFRFCLSDAGLTAFVTLSLALFFRAHARGSRLDGVLAGLAAGLAFLCKGLLGYGIPALAALAYLALRRDLGAIVRLRLWGAVLVGLAVAAPWVLALHAAEGAEGLHRFFIWNHFGRFGEEADHARPFWYYANLLPAALPLTPLALAAVLHRPAAGNPVGDARRAGIAWVAAPLLVLSLAAGKRTTYLLPLYPGLALLATAALVAADAGTLGPRPAALVRGSVTFLRGLTLTFRLRRGRGAARGVVPACVVLAAATVAVDALVLSRDGEVRAGYATAARAGEAAAGRPLLLYQVGEGDIGQFAFALRRRLPVAWTGEQLDRLAGGRPALVVADRDHVRSSTRKGLLDRDILARLRPLGSGAADRTEYDMFELLPPSTGAADPTGGPPGGR